LRGDVRLMPQGNVDLPDEWEDYFGTPLVWTFLLNGKYGTLAVVRATAETPYGNVRAKLRLSCPAGVGSIQVLVGDMEATGFDLDNYSVKSDRPVERKNVVEVRATSPNGRVSFITKAAGNTAYEDLYPTIMFFELTKTRRLQRMIAKGSTAVTFVIHDLDDYQRTISVSFPAIDPSDPMVKDLNGCRPRPLLSDRVKTRVQESE
jgi:hypothetical protein